MLHPSIWPTLPFFLALAVASGCATRDPVDVALQGELDADGFETRVDERGVTVLVADVLFAFDSDALNAEGKARVAKIAEIVTRIAPERALVAEGHTDAHGDDAYNFDLSLRRARRVADALGLAGIDRARLSTQGFGETRPLVVETRPDGSDDPKARQRNRRVEVVIVSR